ncbi:aspartyl/asparaginyl beta-hydroxylase domain-containing protein [Colwelliaceae bacterium 6471]
MNEKLNEIEDAFKAQNNAQGLKLLRAFVDEYPNNVEQLYRLAVIEEQIGTVQKAEACYLACLKLSPMNVMVHLYAGYFFQQQGQLERALAIYSLGNDIDGQLQWLHWREDASYETRLRSYTAEIALKDHFTSLHKKSLESANTSSIINSAIWPQTHNQAFSYLHPHQKPHLFYVPRLLAKPVHDKTLLPWCEIVENNYERISGEFSNLIEMITAKGTPYINKTFVEKEFEALAGSKNWTALYLYNNGVANNELLDLMPQTVDLLKALPLYNLNENPYEVFFSLLKAGQHIKPHFGQSNHSLTVHLPIIVPNGGYLRVADEKHCWQKGKVIAFDDSFEHEAINTTDQDRVVLIFSVWHQDLSENERQDIQKSFSERDVWLKNRHQFLL